MGNICRWLRKHICPNNETKFTLCAWHQLMNSCPIVEMWRLSFQRQSPLTVINMSHQAKSTDFISLFLHIYLTTCNLSYSNVIFAYITNLAFLYKIYIEGFQKVSAKNKVASGRIWTHNTDPHWLEVRCLFHSATQTRVE